MGRARQIRPIGLDLPAETHHRTPLPMTDIGCGSGPTGRLRGSQPNLRSLPDMIRNKNSLDWAGVSEVRIISDEDVAICLSRLRRAPFLPRPACGRAVRGKYWDSQQTLGTFELLAVAECRDS